MALSRNSLIWKLATAAFVFCAVLLALRAVNGSSGPSGGAADSSATARSGVVAPDADIDTRIAALQQGVRANPDFADGYNQLGQAYIQKIRESGDATFYPKAEGVFRRALRLEPRNFNAISGLATLALSRHDFSEGLALGERARRINPYIPRNYGVIADGQVELGRYAAAARTLQRMVDIKPDLTSYSRVSYFRELHGDFPGAIGAMRLAVSAGGETAENVSYVQTLLGNLQLDHGRYGAARHAYREALARDPGYLPAQAGLARLEAGFGHYAAAIRRYRRVTEQLPLPAYAVALGQTEQAAGQEVAAARDYALVRAITKLQQQNGVNTDAELASFEADHGSATRAVALGRRASAAAPSVRSADAYSWALYKAGRIGEASRTSERAMRLGSLDPSFLFHAGMIARRAGDLSLARTCLGRLVSQSPRFNPIFGPQARRALRAIS